MKAAPMRLHGAVESGHAPGGWVVESRRTYKPKDPSKPPMTSLGYWYGPASGFGTTSGALLETYQGRRQPSAGVAWFPTKFAAETALRKVYGRPANWRGHGYTPVRVTADLLEPDRDSR